MPNVRANFATAVCDDKIYTIGGQMNPTVTVEVYDPKTDRWSTGTPLPTARAQMQAATVNGKIYVFGGLTSPEKSYGYINATEIYNPKTDSWSTGAAVPNPNPTYNYGLATLNGKIYLIGGTERFHTPATGGFDTREVNRMQIYDTATDSWTAGPSMPIAVRAVAGATTGEMAPVGIYVFGQNTERGPSLSMQVYDPKTGSWGNGTAPLSFREAPVLAVVNDTFYLMGATIQRLFPDITDGVLRKLTRRHRSRRATTSIFPSGMEPLSRLLHQYRHQRPIF
jgi:N-acetylneuraminic acid mutarotase